MLANGHRGELRVGYQIAAKLGRWSLSVDHDDSGGKSSVLEASVTASNAHWLSSVDTFDLELRLGTMLWLWRNVTPVIDQGTSVSITLVGVPETSTGAWGAS